MTNDANGTNDTATPAVFGDEGSTRAVGARGRGHRWVPAILAAGGLACLVGSVRLGLGELGQPGPGAWPAVASAALVLTASWLAITGIEPLEETDRADLVHVGAAVLATAGFVLLLPLVGMPLPALLMIAAWMRLFGEPWKIAIATAALGVLVLQIVFVNLLGVPLPVGPLAPGA